MLPSPHKETVYLCSPINYKTCMEDVRVNKARFASLLFVDCSHLFIYYYSKHIWPFV